MELKKERIFIGDVYKSLSKYSTENDIDDYNNFGRVMLAKNVILVKFGNGYVPVKKIKNSLHMFVLERKVCPDGMLKYSPEFLLENSDMFSDNFVKNVKPAFPSEKKEESINLSALKKFAKTSKHPNQETLEKI